MQFLTKTLTLSLITFGLTACGGSDGGKNKPSSSSSSSVISSSSSVSSSSISSSSPVSSSSSVSSSSISSSLSSSSVAPSETTLSASTYTGYSVAEIEDCGVGIVDPDDAETLTIFGDYNTQSQNQALGSNYSGWNHTTNGSTTEWVNLTLPSSTYNFSSSAKVNESCNDVDTLNMVFVKKIADWDRQHANGFERKILSDGKKFGNVENLIVDLKINGDKTSIPTVKSLKDTYVPTYVNEAAVDALDAGKVNIGITIYDGFASTVLSASRIIELDQSVWADKWIRVTIPMAELNFCSTKSFTCTPKTLADLNDITIEGIRFVAETKSGNVLRHALQNNWNESIPETFKEVDLSIKKIEFELK